MEPDVKHPAAARAENSGRKSRQKRSRTASSLAKAAILAGLSVVFQNLASKPRRVIIHFCTSSRVFPSQRVNSALMGIVEFELLWTS
jgi:hypothetical protein